MIEKFCIAFIGIGVLLCFLAGIKFFIMSNFKLEAFVCAGLLAGIITYIAREWDI